MTKAELCKKISDQTGCDMQSVSAIVESLMVSCLLYNLTLPTIA